MKLAGNTPLIRIDYKLDGKPGSVYAKLEFYNPSGSIKDRVAEYIVEKALERGELKPGQPIIEVTSGNTGIAFSALGARDGFPVHIFMPEWMSEERKSLMRMYGAIIHEVSREDGGFEEGFRRADILAEEIDGFLPKQFDNFDNIQAHVTGTGPELLKQLPDVTDFVSGIGTGGTLMGTAKALNADHKVKITALEPDSIPIITTGQRLGPHKIEGIGDDFIPGIVDMSLIDDVIDLNDDDAVIMSARLAKELGLGVGISSGANFLVAALTGAEDGRKPATVFTDDNKKYLTTSLSVPPAAKEGMISTRIELLGYSLVSR